MFLEEEQNERNATKRKRNRNGKGGKRKIKKRKGKDTEKEDGRKKWLRCNIYQTMEQQSGMKSIQCCQLETESHDTSENAQPQVI